VSPLRRALEEQIDIYMADADKEKGNLKDREGDVAMSNAGTGSAPETAGSSRSKALDQKRLTLQTSATASTSVFDVQPVLSEVRSTAARSKDGKRRKKGYVDLLRRLDGGHLSGEGPAGPDELEGVRF